MKSEIDRGQYRFDDTNFIPWPVAEQFVRNCVQEFLGADPIALKFSNLLEVGTSTTLWDFLDHIKIRGVGDEGTVNYLEGLGFVPEHVPAESHTLAFRHRNARLPRIVVDTQTAVGPRTLEVAICCNSLRLLRCQFDTPGVIEGSPFGRFARCTLSGANGQKLIAVYRCAYRGYIPIQISNKEENAIRRARDLWLYRRWSSRNDKRMMEKALTVSRAMKDLVDADMAASLVCEEECGYWQSRNKAAKFQKGRQDFFGLGWANHDHYTFRSSREHFRMLIKILETLGFQCRERLYSGSEHGWGAQILEQPVSGLVIFADVDLAPEEANIDFAHKNLLPLPRLGTIGLWCDLHGESILHAGMHHLEIQCSFDRFRNDFANASFGVMEPFNDDREKLRQAFTIGEQWPVEKSRLDRLLKKQLITPEQYTGFAERGAVGSHLEHLWRGGGFKGFQKSAVDKIIDEIDPRKIS